MDCFYGPSVTKIEQKGPVAQKNPVQINGESAEFFCVYEKVTREVKLNHFYFGVNGI